MMRTFYKLKGTDGPAAALLPFGHAWTAAQRERYAAAAKSEGLHLGVWATRVLDAASLPLWTED